MHQYTVSTCQYQLKKQNQCLIFRFTAHRRSLLHPSDYMTAVLQILYRHFVLSSAMAMFGFFSEMTAATAYWDPQLKVVQLKEGVLETEGDAYGYLNDTLSSTGWSVLEIRAGYGKTPETDEITFFLAGYLEGFLTAQ